jgi:hypothetical protein
MLDSDIAGDKDITFDSRSNFTSSLESERLKLQLRNFED